MKQKFLAGTMVESKMIQVLVENLSELPGVTQLKRKSRLLHTFLWIVIAVTQTRKMEKATHSLQNITRTRKTL